MKSTSSNPSRRELLAGGVAAAAVTAGASLPSAAAPVTIDPVLALFAERDRLISLADAADAAVRGAVGAAAVAELEQQAEAAYAKVMAAEQRAAATPAATLAGALARLAFASQWFIDGTICGGELELGERATIGAFHDFARLLGQGDMS